MARFHLIVVAQRRRGGQRQGGLGHVITRIFLDQFSEAFVLGRRGVRPDHHPVTAGFVGRLHHQFVQIGQHVFPVLLPHAQIGRHVGDERILIEVVLDDLRHEGVHDFVVGHARARRVGQRHLALAPGPHQSRYAERGVGEKHFGVQEQVVDAPVDHVHPLRPLDGAHVDAVVVVDFQVAAFHQFHAHLLGEIGMLEIGRVVDAGREHHHGRLIAGPGRQRGQHVVEPQGVVVHRLDALVLEQFGEHPLGHDPVFQHVGHPGRDAEIIFQHINGAVLVAHQIAAADVCPDPMAGVDAHALWPKVDRFCQHLGGKDAVLDDFLLVVKVVDEQIQRLHPLFQAGFRAIPFLPGDDARHDVERPRPVDAAALGVDGKRNAHDQDGEFGGGLALAQIRVAQGSQILAQRPGRGTRPRRAVDEFVVEARRGVMSPLDGHRIVL